MSTSPGAGRLERRYRIGRTTLLSLLAGRGTYRLIQVTTTVLLLPAWGNERYQVYAAAMASFSWLTALTFTGPEKTVLKLLPRAPRSGPMIIEAFLAVLWVAPVPLLIAYFTALLLVGGAPVAIYLGVATMLLGGGCTMLLVGLHRAVGRPWQDVGSFLLLSVSQLALLLACVAGWLGPPGYLTTTIATQLVVNAVLAVRLGRPSLRIRQRTGYLRRIVWTVLLMSGGEVGIFLATAVMFNLLAASSWAWQISELYVAITVWSVAFNLLLYLLRVFIPRMSLRLAGGAARTGRRRSATAAATVLVVDLAWLALAGLVLAQLDLADLVTRFGPLVWGVLLISRAPAMMLVTWASYLLENTDARAPRITGLASMVNLGLAGLVGLMTVPAWGGAGVMVGLAVAELGQAVVLLLGARGRFARRRPVPAPAAAVTGSTPG